MALFDHPVAMFCHIPKTGGMTINHLLRRHWGWRHLEPALVRGTALQPADLRRELFLNPVLRSVAGHDLRPAIDFGPLQPRLRWYTMLREPVARCISHYQHQVEKMGQKADFATFLRKPHNLNWQVRMLADDPNDLDLAKRMLAERIRVVGLFERYDEFLVMVREDLGWPGFNIRYGTPRNPPRSGTISKRLKADVDRYRDVLEETNSLDFELYRYAVEELYPRQVEVFGAERLEQGIRVDFKGYEPTLQELARRWQSTLYSKGFHGSLVKAMRKFAR